MKKSYLFLATAAILSFASCTNSDYLGEADPNAQVVKDNGAIRFGGAAGKFTRATSNTGSFADMLDGQMKIFGVKKANTGPVYTTVFDNYVVWSNTTNVTTSNPDATTATAEENGWEYVTASPQSYGTTTTAGTTGVQYIKYWDWGTDEYHFVAGSPVKSFTYNISGGEIASATVADIYGHINPNAGTALSKDPVYIAAPVKKVKGSGGDNEYNTDVQFEFTRQQTYVRVGVYETIPGYKITSIDFYEWDYANTTWKATPQNNHNIVLNSKTQKYFKGTNASSASVTVTYNWTTTPASYTLDYGTAAPVEQESWYGGKLDLDATNPLATSSTDANKDYFYGTDADIDNTTRYFTVLPTPSETAGQPIIIKCDYELTALDGAETIKVSGATAAIPAAFCKWNPNTTYTYLFKISNNTNGKTDPSQPNEGLYPITFDATVIAEVSGTEQGYITTVSTPSITTYQEGSVIASGVEYVKDSPIYFTAQNDESGDMSTLLALDNVTPATRMVQVYSVGAGTTEADLILTRPTTTVATTIGDAQWKINEQTVAANKWAQFTPTTAGTYAIEYITAISPGVAYAYKVITVEDNH